VAEDLHAPGTDRRLPARSLEAYSVCAGSAAPSDFPSPIKLLVSLAAAEKPVRAGQGIAAGCCAGDAWPGLLGEADRRGLTPLFWQHVRPYEEVRLGMGARLRIGRSG
jgi:hypothetical protein